MELHEREARFVKVLLDTNVILDFALERQPWFVDSEQIMSLKETLKVFFAY